MPACSSAARLAAIALSSSLPRAVASVGPAVPADRLPLRARGNRIVDRHGASFRLKCVNWYGASGDRFVVLGLHARSVAELVGQVSSLGFNCVRLPFSLELYHQDPPVPRAAVSADGPLSGQARLSGLQAYDAVVRALAAAGVAVIIDNHSTTAHWCCNPWDPDGIWFTPDYPEASWSEALVGLARRYRDNPYVVAVELRNEVRDAAGTQAIWSASNHNSDGAPYAEWSLAAERAGNEVLRESPDVLIVVTGLCYGQDLRGVRDRTIELSVPGRLVWTAHSYHWYVWWNYTHGWYAIGGVLVALDVASACSAVALYRRGYSPTRWAVLDSVCAWIALAGVVLLVAAQAVRSIMAYSGCKDLAHRSVGPYWAAGVALLLLAALLFACRLAHFLARRRRRRLRQLRVVPYPDEDAGGEGGAEAADGRGHSAAMCVPSLGVLALVLASGAVFAFCAPSTWFLHAMFDRMWGFASEPGKPYTAPVLLSEFGTDVDSHFWRALVSYVGSKELSFAYWPLNGQKWEQERGSLVDETYGLVDKDWRSVRHHWKLRGLVPATNS